MATDSPVFETARAQMASALALLLDAGTAAGTVRDDVTGSTLLRALGGICGMRATEGWLGEAQQITALLFDGLRYGTPRATVAGPGAVFGMTGRYGGAGYPGGSARRPGGSTTAVTAILPLRRNTRVNGTRRPTGSGSQNTNKKKTKNKDNWTVPWAGTASAP